MFIIYLTKWRETDMGGEERQREIPTDMFYNS